MESRTARTGTLAAAALTVVWHFRVVSEAAAASAPGFPFLSTGAALAACMLAVYVWFGDEAS